MFRQIKILTRGAQRHLSMGQLLCNKYNFKKDPQTFAALSQKKEKSVSANETSALVVSVKSEEGGGLTDTKSGQFENSPKLNRREALRRMIKENNKDANEQMSSGSNQVAEYGQSTGWRQPWVPMPCYRGPVVKKETTEVDPKTLKDEKKLKLNRRDCLRLMYKEKRMNPEEKKPTGDMQMDSKTNKESLDPTRLQMVNLKWKERQQEIQNRMQGTDKKYVSRFEMNAGRKEKIQ